MYRKHQAEKKSRISLNSESTKANESVARPLSTQNQQRIDQIQIFGRSAVPEQEKGGSKTTAADRAALEKEQRDSENFYAIDVETNGFKHNEPI